jgi:hypothetical protein
MFADLKQKLARKTESPGEEARDIGLPASGGLTDKLAGLDKKRLYTALATLIVAGSAGYLMQRGAQPPAQAVPQMAASEFAAPVETAPAPVDLAAAPLAEPVAGPGTMPETSPVPELAEAPAAGPFVEPDLPEVTRAATDRLLTLEETAPAGPLADQPLEFASVSDIAEPAPGPLVDEPVADACTVAMDAAAVPGALVALTVEAPCNSGEEVGFEHFGLRFSEQLGPDGRLDLLVPAMADDAIIVVSFADGAQASTEVAVPDFGDYERVALVWHGATGLQLHALENGASYDDPGHIWAEAPGAPSLATEGQGGFVSVLGSTAAGYAADVYTYPASLVGSGQEPEISIEARVMENTCGSRIEGSFLRSNAGRAPTVTGVTMAVPGCDAVGDYLVLKNLPRELKIARN